MAHVFRWFSLNSLKKVPRLWQVYILASSAGTSVIFLQVRHLMQKARHLKPNIVKRSQMPNKIKYGVAGLTWFTRSCM